MDPFSKLVNYFTRFPGVGNRQAKRFVYFLLTEDRKALEDLSEMVLSLKRTVSQCTHCYRYFNIENNPDKTLCPICEAQSTNKTIMMLVEKDVDLETVEKSGAYNGRYFVFGGLIPLVKKRFIVKTRLTELEHEIKRAVKEEALEEIMFGFSVNSEGEHTKEIVLNTLLPLIKEHNIRVTTLGRGLSTGAELEYSDDDTLKNALKNRY
jgi:recombination protein RecR